VSPFLSACSYVSALLGPADALRARTVTPAGVLPALARWGREGGVSLTVTDGVNDLIPTLRAERLDGDFRAWRSIGDGTVRDACAWLGWTVPRTTLPGLAPPDAALRHLGLDAATLDAAWQGALDEIRAEGGDPDAVVRRAGEVLSAWHDAPAGFDANGSPVEAA
jgi:hypothetical protein